MPHPPAVPPSLPDFGAYPPPVSETSQSLKARSFGGSRSSRPSPYGLVAKNTKCDCLEGAAGGQAVKRASWAARKRYPSMSANGKPKAVELEDPLEMLHELIRYGQCSVAQGRAAATAHQVEVEAARRRHQNKVT